MPVASTPRKRALTAATACAVVAALAAAPASGAATKPKPKQPGSVFVSGGFASVQFDTAVLAPLGIAVEPRESAKPTATGLRFKIFDGKTTLRFPLKSTIHSVGNMGLRQAASGANLNFTDFTAALGATKSVLSAKSGEGIGYGGPRQTLLRLAPTAPGVLVKTARLQVTNVPITLTATGTTVFNTLFGVGLPTPPFALGQTVGTLNIKTRWYLPKSRARRS